MDVPPQVREHIYRYFGVAPLYSYHPDMDDAVLHGRIWSATAYASIHELDGGFNRVFCYGGVPWPLTSNFHGLLLSCRTLYAEAARLLYSQNMFVVRDLEPLRALVPPPSPPCKVSRLSSARRRATASRATTRPISGVAMHAIIPPASPQLLPSETSAKRKSSATTAATISLRSAGTTPRAETCSKTITPNRLELALVCDVDDTDVKAGELAVAPLCLLPQLRNCHVRLCRTRYPQLQQVAEHAVLHACRFPPVEQQQPPHISSRLLSLPRELRFRILEDTDLITPWSEVTWSRQHGGSYFESEPACLNPEGFDIRCPPDIHAGCRLRRCWDNMYPAPSLGCFCRRQHTAASSACRCWASSRALFLVCRTLCDDARAVFFSGNRFVVHDYLYISPFTAPDPDGEYPGDRFAASQFLRDVVPAGCHRYLRFLELVFPAYSHRRWPRDDDHHPALRDWRDTVEWLRPRINDPVLTLRVVMSESCEDDPPEDRPQMTKAQGDKIIAAYRRILHPLTRLTLADNDGNALARFYAQLACPWSRTAEAPAWSWTSDDSYRRDLVPRMERLLRERAERLVMGDRYDSLYPPDAEEPSKCLWQERYARIYY
ncbi:hypothetical protein B0H63DRAFT_534715 [Podospora didyma]|uniref:F-box domain-containing protein n=1 Tax=Podospora didyma TaxID=330526 RepID=A0AAE0K330_9PEZI|nr:hypothetical protein B0H63DRAFT_534715 [Podospora didyma]